jgi:hypothetical protein
VDFPFVLRSFPNLRRLRCLSELWMPPGGSLSFLPHLEFLRVVANVQRIKGINPTVFDMLLECVNLREIEFDVRWHPTSVELWRKLLTSLPLLTVLRYESIGTEQVQMIIEADKKKQLKHIWQQERDWLHLTEKAKKKIGHRTGKRV